MAPPPITEDYYMILGILQNATSEQISKAYKQLARELHPDRNKKQDATQAFQRLGLAYETLSDVAKRRSYDLVYPSIKQNRSPPQYSQTSNANSSSKPHPEALSEAAQLAFLQKSKRERAAQWWTKKSALDSPIFELQRVIRRLEQEIRVLDMIASADAADEAQKNSWGTWLMSPLFKKVEGTEEEKERKNRDIQERRIEKDMKERRIEVQRTNLKKEENALKKAKEEFDAADAEVDRKIGVIQSKIWARESQERQERERVQRERLAKVQEQQREATAAALRKRQAEAREAEQKRQAEARAEQRRHEEEMRKWQETIDRQARERQKRFAQHNNPMGSTFQASTSSCSHEGWWDKVHGRKACPMCDEEWTYLLKCPSCPKKACPKCQASIRQRRGRPGVRPFKRNPPKAKTPTPEFYGADDYY